MTSDTHHPARIQDRGGMMRDKFTPTCKKPPKKTLTIYDESKTARAIHCRIPTSAQHESINSHMQGEALSHRAKPGLDSSTPKPNSQATKKVPVYEKRVLCHYADWDRQIRIVRRQQRSAHDKPLRAILSAILSRMACILLAASTGGGAAGLLWIRSTQLA